MNRVTTKHSKIDKCTSCSKRVEAEASSGWTAIELREWHISHMCAPCQRKFFHPVQPCDGGGERRAQFNSPIPCGGGKMKFWASQLAAQRAKTGNLIERARTAENHVWRIEAENARLRDELQAARSSLFDESQLLNAVLAHFAVSPEQARGFLKEQVKEVDVARVGGGNQEEYFEARADASDYDSDGDSTLALLRGLHNIQERGGTAADEERFLQARAPDVYDTYVATQRNRQIHTRAIEELERSVEAGCQAAPPLADPYGFQSKDK